MPLRSVLHIHGSELQPTYAIFNFIDGVNMSDLNKQELLDTVPSVLEYLSILKSIEVSDADGYGRFDGTGNAPYSSWLDFVKSIYNEKIYNWSDVEKKGIEVELIDAAIQKLKSGVDGISINKKQLVHGDLGSYNLIANNRNITGIIDWSYGMYGDHLYDIANLLFWNEDRLQPLIAKLIIIYTNTPEVKRTITCYMLRIGLEELYNTVILNEVGYDVEWVADRLRTITNGLE